MLVFRGVYLYTKLQLANFFFMQDQHSEARFFFQHKVHPHEDGFMNLSNV